MLRGTARWNDDAHFVRAAAVAMRRALGISERTVRRDWTLARAWLLRELSGP
jgi:hypothetical protein